MCCVVLWFCVLCVGREEGEERCVCVVWRCVCCVRCVGGGCVQDFRGCVQDVGAPRLTPSPDPSLPPLSRTAQNFALFSLSRHNVLSFFSLLGVFSLNFGGV